MTDPKSNPPLVLHVIHHLQVGGMENGLVNLINNMPQDRYRHAIACIEHYTDFRERIRVPDVPVYALHRDEIGVWALRRKLYDLCRELQPTIVHSRNQSGLDALLPATLAGVRHRVHGEHGWDVDNLRGEKLKPTVLKALHSPLVSRYITVSRDLKDYLQQRIRVSPRRITQIYNGVDTDRFHPRTEEPQPSMLPAQMQADGAIVIGTVGRAQPVKDQATLLRAFAKLRDSAGETLPPLRLMLVGDGPSLPELQQLAAELAITDHCHFSGSIDEVDLALRSMDLFVLPSLNEGISNTLLEAMASGLPLLATDVGGNPELVPAGASGALFAAGDVGGLAHLLHGYAEDAVRRQREGEVAREHALANYSMTAMVNQYAAVYDELRNVSTHGSNDESTNKPQ